MIQVVIDNPGWAFDITFSALSHRFPLDIRCKDDLGDLSLDNGPILTATSRLSIGMDPRLYSTGVCSYFWDYTKEGPPPNYLLEEWSDFRAVYVPCRGLFRRLSSLDNIFFTPSGVDPEIFKPSPETPLGPEKFTVGWAGNSDRSVKRFKVIQSACEKLDVQLNTAMYGKPSQIKNQYDMAYFYNGLSVYVNASSSEGELKTVKEAMACGVPVVSTPVGCVPELIKDGENGFIFDGREESLLDILKFIQRAPSLLEGMRAEALLASRLFWWENVEDYWEEFFNHV